MDYLMNHARGNGKTFTTLMSALEDVGFGDDIVRWKEKYRPVLEYVGLLDTLPEWQEILLYYYLENPKNLPNYQKEVNTHE